MKTILKDDKNSETTICNIRSLTASSCNKRNGKYNFNLTTADKAGTINQVID